ncbi:MAG: hypothetical protein WC223_13790, partial [Bacteroidales bacterium]
MKTEIKDLRAIIGNIPIKRVCLEDETLHEIFIKNGSEAVKEKLSNTIDIDYTEANDTSLSVPETSIKEETAVEKIQKETKTIIPDTEQITNPEPKIIENRKLTIESIYDGKLLLRNEFNNYYILGSLTQDLSTLRTTLIIEEKTTGRKERTKVDLYERESLRYLAEQVADIFCQNPEQIEIELLQLTDELEKYREQQLEQIKNEYKIRRNFLQIAPEKEKQIIEFLKSPDLISKIDKLIEQAGVVGEENTRKLLFIIASTYKMNYPLHSLIQGTSGSGKSHLINTIGQCFPPEDVMSMTRVTSKSFYHYTKEELVDKLMLIQDYDGLDEEAQYAFRELQSAGVISSSTIYKDRTGNLNSLVKVVKSHFASMLATTKAEIYYDSMSRSIIIGVDESEEQTQKII